MSISNSDPLPHSRPWSHTGLPLFALQMALFLFLALALQATLYLIAKDRLVPHEVTLFYDGLQQHQDILCFGDSTLIEAEENDADPRALAQMFQEDLTDYAVSTVAHYAYALDTFHEYAQALARSSSKPRLVVIPINMRSFSPEWDLRPQYQFVKEWYFIRHTSPFTRALFKPLAVFRAIDLAPISQAEYERSRTVCPGNPAYAQALEKLGPENSLTLLNQPVASHIIGCYMYRLAPDHRKARALLNTTRLLTEANIQVLYYFTPIDVTTCARQIGPAYSEILTQNIDTLKQMLSPYPVTILDLTEALPPEAFSWGKAPDEHLHDTGRRALAARLAQQAQALFEPATDPSRAVGPGVARRADSATPPERGRLLTQRKTAWPSKSYLLSKTMSAPQFDARRSGAEDLP